MAEIIKPSDLSKIWANSGDRHQPSDSKINQGWIKEVPTYQDFNFLQNKTDSAIAHINQHGISVWDNSTPYIANKSYVQGSNGKLYVAKVDSANVDPVTDTTEVSWRLFIDSTLINLPQVALTLVNGWANSATPVVPFVATVRAGVLYLNGAINGASASGPLIATLPTGYRPSSRRMVNANLSTLVGTYNALQITIETTGALNMYPVGYGAAGNIAVQGAVLL